MAADDPLSPGHLIHHVQDATYFEIPRFVARLGERIVPQLFEAPPAEVVGGVGKLKIPQPFAVQSTGPDNQPLFDHHGDPVYESIWHPQTGIDVIDEMGLFQPMTLTLTKYMVLQIIVALILCALFIGFARSIRGGQPPRGRLWNLLEAMLIFLRDNVARPAIGRHDADRFMPLIWTLFFFVLGCNLMGLVPWMGSPTGALAVTGALALVTFATVIGAGSVRLGPVGFWKAQVPHMDLPKAMAIILIPLIFVIEVGGLLIKHVVLCIRLWANMTGGHLVLAVLMGFIAATAGIFVVWLGVMPVSILGAVAVNLLEILIAFIQAYIFAFLTSLFIGMAVHPH